MLEARKKMQIQFWGITQKSHYFHQRHASKLDPKSNSTFTNLITDSPYKLGIKEKGEKTHISKHFHQSYWGKVCINILAWSTMIININDTLAPKECSFPYRQMCSQCQRISVLHESITVLGGFVCHFCKLLFYFWKQPFHFSIYQPLKRLPGRLWTKFLCHSHPSQLSSLLKAVQSLREL